MLGFGAVSAEPRVVHHRTRRMSSFYDYTPSARKYEEARVPTGVNHVLGALHVKLGKPLGQLRVLDAGCGTGNYAKELLDAGVGRVDLLDANDAMMDIARLKLRTYVEAGSAGIIKHRLPELPFPEQTFDCVLFMAVLHHLDKQEVDASENTVRKPSFPNLWQALKEAKRVLRPGGFVVVMAGFADQVKSIWWNKLIPEAIERYCIQMATYQDFRAAFDSADLGDVETIVVLDKPAIADHVYYDPEGPLKEETWRSCSSSAFATPEEMEAARQRLLEAKQKGTLKELMLELDKDHQRFGSFCLIFAQN